jgi:hypothetical protein
MGKMGHGAGSVWKEETRGKKESTLAAGNLTKRAKGI